jgi:hypothetical protein
MNLWKFIATIKMVSPSGCYGVRMKALGAIVKNKDVAYFKGEEGK